MPLKGVLLGATVYPSALARDMQDVDVLVPPERFAEALECLSSVGYEVIADLADTATTLSSPYPLTVDLHQRLFPPGLFALDTAGVFSRARPDDRLFGIRMLLPDPYDLYAHLVGHFAKSRMDERCTRPIGDFARVARFHELDPARCARHLDRHGLSRAARYALPYAVAHDDDPFARDVLEELPCDPLGACFARLAQALVRRLPLGATAALVSPHLVNSSTPAAARSLAQHLFLGARARAAEACGFREAGRPL